MTLRDKEGTEVTAKSDVEVLKVLDDYRDFIQSAGKKWETKEGLAALGIDAGWLADPFVMDVITRFLYYRNAPHEAFEGPIEKHPAIWVEESIVLDAIFGVSL